MNVRAGLVLLLALTAATASSAPPAPDGAAPAGDPRAGAVERLLGEARRPALEPIPPAQAFVLTVRTRPAHALVLRFDVHDCCYLYRDRLRFELVTPGGPPGQGPRVGPVRLPPGESVSDAYFGESVVYRQRLDLRLPLLDVPARAAFALEVRFQGCSEKGVDFCYEPLVRRFRLRAVDGRIVVEEPMPPRRAS